MSEKLSKVVSGQAGLPENGGQRPLGEIVVERNDGSHPGDRMSHLDVVTALTLWLESGPLERLDDLGAGE